MNTNARTLMTLTAGLAVGFLVALAVLGKQPMATEAVEAGSRALDRPAAPALVDDTLQLAAPGAAPGDAARAIAEVNVTEAPEAERRILHGIVLGPDDEPIAGATIVGYIPAESRSSRGSSGSTYTEPTLEEELAEARRKALASRKRRRIATSREDGTFRMDLPKSAQGRLRTYLEDYTFEIDRASRSRGSSPDDPMIVKGNPILWLTLDVRLPDGTQPDEARITLTQRSGSGSSSSQADWTPEHPKVSNRFGKAAVAASAGPDPSTRGFQDASPWRSSEVKVAGTAGEAATIQLEERRRLSIELVDPSADLDAPGAWLRLVETHLFDPEHPGRGLERHLGFDEQPVEIGGRSVYFDVEPGDWTILAGRGPMDDLLGATNSIQVVVGDGETRCRVEAPPFDPSEYVTITCLDPTGESLDKVRFTIQHESNGGSSSSGLSGLSRQSAGHYRVAARGLKAGNRLSGSGPVTTTLTATHADFGAQSVIVKANAPTLTVQFEAPATVDVVVQGYTSGRYWVSVTGVGRSAFSSGRDDQGLVDAEGHARVGPVAPGDYTVVLQAAGDSGGHFGRKRLASVEITVRPGENRVSIPLPTLHEVRVEAPGLGEGSALTLELQDAGFYDRHEANVDGSGVATFEGVPAGTYRLRSRGASAPMTIQVPPTSHVFEAKEVNALAVSIQDPQGLLGAAGFQTGDIIYGANGTEFANMVQVQTQFMDLSSGAVDWMVDRGGSTMTLRAGPWEGDMGTLAPRLGGSFEPASR